MKHARGAGFRGSNGASETFTSNEVKVTLARLLACLLARLLACSLEQTSKRANEQTSKQVNKQTSEHRKSLPLNCILIS